MKNMKKYIVLALLSFLILPSFSQALTPLPPTISSVQNMTFEQILAALRENPGWMDSLLKELRDKPKPPRPEWCYNFEKNMGVGDRGDQVKALRKAIGDDDQDNDRFDEKLASKMVKFQEDNKDEILKPLGLSRGSGYLGASTRKWLNRYHACAPKPYPRPVDGNMPPVISGVSGPTVLNINQTGTWTVQASDPENGQLNYSVIWGDEPTVAFARGESGLLAAQTFTQTAIFTHTYNQAGSFQPYFLVKDNAGKVVSAGLSVRVGDVSSNPSITVTSPNGGENWVANSVQPISWTWTPNPMASYAGYPKVDLYLDPFEYQIQCFAYPCPQPLPVFRGPFLLDKSIAMNAGSATYNWIVATDINNQGILPGKYQVRICPAGATTNCDSSNNPFTITSGVTQSPAISALSPISAAVGAQVTITGSGFTSSGNKIKFGDLATELNPGYSLNSTNNGTTLTFTVPTSRYYACSAGNPPCLVAQYLTPPGVYPVSVTNANGMSNTVNFTVFSVTN